MISREAVLAKFDGHCAYCGKEITLKEMQVDHIKPKKKGGLDETDNLYPACRRCNFYKSSGTPEYLRWRLKDLHDRLNKIYIYKVAIDYGMVTETPFSGKFYFEKVAEEQNGA